MSNCEDVKQRLEKDLRERINNKLSFENYKITVQPSGYSEGNDILLTFSYQRMEKGDFSFMDFSKFEEHMIDYKNMIDYRVSKCVLYGSFTYLGEYDPKVTQGTEDGGVSICGSDLHLTSIDGILGVTQLDNSSNDENEVSLENEWLKKETKEWIDLSDEEYEEIDKELFFDISFLKSIMDVIQKEIYDFLLELSTSCPDEYRLLGVNVKAPISASFYDKSRAEVTNQPMGDDDEIPF